jgi:hypothetical protein
LPVEDPAEMEEVLWELLEFDRGVEAFKVGRPDLFEASGGDD